MLTFVQQLRRDEDGAALVEYTVLLGIMLVAVILTISAVGGWISNQWTSLCTDLNNVGAPNSTCSVAGGGGTTPTPP
jgi:pilus assembly protein Flp/PilA